MKKAVWIFAVLVTWGVASCKEDSTDDVPIEETKLVVKSDLAAWNIPASDSIEAVGAADGTLIEESRVLKLTITYSGVDSLTGWHIYRSESDTTAGTPVINLGTNFVSPFSFSDTLTSDQVTDLKAGLYYLGIQSKNFTDGELRGKLTVD